MKVHKTTFCPTSSLYGEKLSTFTIDEKSPTIYWMGGWVAPKAGSGAKRRKRLYFSGTEQRAPERSDHYVIIIIIIQLPQDQPMLTTGCIVCFMKPENTQRKKSRLEFPSEVLGLGTPY